MKNSVSTIKQIIAAYNNQFNAEELPINRLAPDDSLVELLAAIVDENHTIDAEYPEDVIEALESLQNDVSDDFTLDFDGNEYRIIADSAIWNIYRDEIKQIVEDCYSDVLNLDNIPSFIAFEINWEQTAKNAYVDGYGHTFSGYDGSEIETSGFHIFRTN